MLDTLIEFIQHHPRLLLLTGAGVSTASGIPDYRDREGQWKQTQPMTYQDFIGSHRARQRYWARSAIGWRRFRAARPNSAHQAIAQLERQGRVSALITQNVDCLHQRAGSERVINLHGRLDEAICLDCQAVTPRLEVQHYLLENNPILAHVNAEPAADGDAHLNDIDFSKIEIPACRSCGGLLKPNVVFFGESVPRDRVEASYQALQEADALLVIGSSLMVYSGFRFARHAAQQGQPVVSINHGVTRADSMLSFKVDADCSELLPQLITALSA